MESFDGRQKLDVESLEFISEFREKMAERLRNDYPLERAEKLDLPDKVEKGETKFPSNSWVGDVFAHVSGLYRLREGEISKLRKIILAD